MELAESDFKRVFFDIETSPNVVLSWRTGRKVNIPYENIIQERKIICICWKEEGERKVHHLTWDKNKDDKKMLKTFLAEMDTADEVIGHNSDNFDIKWLRTRALYYRIPCPPEIKSIDTYKEAKKLFRFNSNTLDYINKFIGGRGKMDTGGFKLWWEITIDGNEKSLNKMVRYCKTDVRKLEEVFKALNPYIKSKTHIGRQLGRSLKNCSECASSNTSVHKRRITAKGYKQFQLQCNDCGKYFTIAASRV